MKIFIHCNLIKCDIGIIWPFYTVESGFRLQKVTLILPESL